MLLLPLPAYPAYNVITTIDGVDYELVYTYDEHRDLWRLGVNSRSGDVVMGHRPLLPFVQMRPNAFASSLEGVFALIAPMHTDDAYEALTGGLWSVVYGDPSEIAELADSLADLAGDADTPVVPIEVLYPPNNAILSNPVVTFSGTGPANQLLFARGEGIQIDSTGSWVWTHTFSESNPVVVFEGESGQRATVRFSIIMQPLLINPVGEDIDGTRYAFTEDVEVTGAATPNSTITVNGQHVIVGGDGTWSVELTLQAGQSHVITAQGGDGQIAQASVYVWGESDLLALQPSVWLDPSDVATLFIDAAGTTPVVASGDPVGLWVNKGTLGAVGDASQAVSANRFVWTDAGGGVMMGNGELITSDATRFAPPRSVAIYAGSTPTGTPSRDIAGWKRGAGYSDDMSMYINSSLNRIWRIPRNIDRLSDDADVSLVVESASGLIVGKTLSSTVTNMVTPRGQFSTPFRVMPGSGNFVGHVFIFDRELTEPEATKLLQWMEAQHGI